MPLEYVGDQAGANPMILMFSSDPEEWKRLHEAIKKLLALELTTVTIHELPGWRDASRCTLVGRMASRDTGIRQVAPGRFECGLTRTWWDNNEGLVKPFTDLSQGSGIRHQFLTVPGGDIEWCISTSRTF